MNKEIEILLEDIELPSIDIDLTGNAESKDVVYENIPDVDENQLLVEGVADLKDHPEMEPFLEKLYELKNEIHQKVKNLSKDHELSGFVKVLFSVRKKA